jgi:rfaE bifunctional protein nucleotidyltransferase chain/domain
MTTVGLNTKLKSIDELAGILALLKQDGKTIVLCHGVFDLLHPGHIRHFQAAKREGDVLVVTLTKDEYVNKGPGRPAFNEHLRAESIAALDCVDYVAINEWPIAVETINRLRPDVYCKGNDYVKAEEDITGKIMDEEMAVNSVGGRIHFTNEITFSSTTLLNRHFDVFSDEAQNFLNDFRQKYTARDIINRLQGLRNMKVLIVGDTIIDEYHYCKPLGKSPKEILIPARYVWEESFAGGILAITNHIAGFCNRVDVVTCLGSQNSYEGFIKEHLQPNIQARFFYHPNAPTIIKRRFVEVDLLRKLFEVYIMDGNRPSESVSQEVCSFLQQHAKEYDLVIVGDYGHGLLDKEIIKTVCAEAKFLAVNAQTNSANIGFNLITKYPQADYICIDESEMRLATHDNFSPMEYLLNDVAKMLHCRKASATLGHKGALVYDTKHGLTSIPVFSREVVDRVGAGDAFLSLTSPCAAAGFAPEVIGFIGNAVGALKIRIVGNKSSVEPVSLFKYINTLLK